MASAAASPRDVGPGWMATLLGVLVLVFGGFLAGLLVGIVSQEPELVAGHLAGRSEVVDWSPQPLQQEYAAQPGLPAVSAGQGSELEVPDPAAFRPERVKDARFSDQLAAAPLAQAAPLPPAAPDLSDGSYAVQVGAFGDGETAESLARALTDKGFAAYVTPSAGDSAQRWRVRVGPVESHAEADTIARRLKVDEQLPTWVLNQTEN